MSHRKILDIWCKDVMEFKVSFENVAFRFGNASI